MPSSTPTRFYATTSKSVEDKSKPTYLILLVPPFWGSSALEGLLSTSPSVSTMCHLGKWQCEATWSLIDDGAFSEQDKWNVDKTNWTQVYELFETRRYFDDPTKPLLMDKSPPNLLKAESLVAFFDTMDYYYRFIGMMRHPCTNSNELTKRIHADGSVGGERAAGDQELRYADLMRKAQDAADPKRFFTLSYDDLRTRPDLVAQELLAWLPKLVSLEINASNIETGERVNVAAESMAVDHPGLVSAVREGTPTGRAVKRTHLVRPLSAKDRELPLFQYISSEKCSLHNSAPSTVYNETDLVRWAQCKYCGLD